MFLTIINRYYNHHSILGTLFKKGGSSLIYHSSNILIIVWFNVGKVCEWLALYDLVNILLNKQGSLQQGQEGGVTLACVVRRSLLNTASQLCLYCKNMSSKNVWINQRRSGEAVRMTGGLGALPYQSSSICFVSPREG